MSTTTPTLGLTAPQTTDQVANTIAFLSTDMTAIDNFAARFQTKRVTTGSVNPGLSNLVHVFWTTPFADANYTAVATVFFASGTLDLIVEKIALVDALHIDVLVNNQDSVSHTGTLHAIAIHD